MKDYDQLQKPDEGTEKTEEILGQWSNMIQQINELDSEVRIMPPITAQNNSLVELEQEQKVQQQLSFDNH